MTDSGKAITAIIADDSLQARKLLRLMIFELNAGITVLAEAVNGKEAVDLTIHLKPDVLFLDINMPEKNGIDVAESLLNTGNTSSVIFTTAYDGYAIQAFRLSAMDYLLKPIREEELKEAVERVLRKKEEEWDKLKLRALAQNLSKPQAPVLCITTQQGYEYLNPSEIEYLEADGSYVHLHIENKKVKTVSKNLKYFEQSLSSLTHFVRVHRSFIINMHYLAAFNKADRGIIVLKSGIEIDLARDRRNHFFEILNTMHNT